eukprot:TRINITY_DN70421_c0_g1_i1.p1 TRINITY_DN70421_c0_g1~~TRINITY_DN70421_c0_g1_i1.p1  ORF type:complete len:265 (+),score=24.38 TRINITY_DN70421_c0_g1_i1:44-796(+)
MDTAASVQTPSALGGAVSFIATVSSLCCGYRPAATADEESKSAKQEYPFDFLWRSGICIDSRYPGTAVGRLNSVLQRVKDLDCLNGPWPKVRSMLLHAGGIRENHSTRDAFNDDRHWDLTTMLRNIPQIVNDGACAKDVPLCNVIGPHIVTASVDSIGIGYSWCTCLMGCHHEPPDDMAHTEFSSRVTFKLVWVPPMYDRFVLVDDEGGEIRRGSPQGELPLLKTRKKNFARVRGGKYAIAAVAISKESE